MDRTPGCVSSKPGLDALGVILTRPSAPPGGPGHRFFPAAEDLGKTRPGERSDAHLVGPRWAPCPSIRYPFGFVGPAVALLCCGASSFPDCASQDGEGTYLEADPPTPHQLTRQLFAWRISDTSAHFFFFFFFMVFNDPKTEAWRAAFTGERC